MELIDRYEVTKLTEACDRAIERWYRLKFGVSRYDGITIIKASGNPNQVGASKFYDLIPKPSTPKIVLDILGIRYEASFIVGGVVNFYREQHLSSSDFCVVTKRKDLFIRGGLSPRFFPAFSTIEEAKAHFFK